MMNEGTNGMPGITLSPELMTRLADLAKRYGYDDTSEFITEILSAKTDELERLSKSSAYVASIAKKVRQNLLRKGIEEEEMLEKYEQFRAELYKEHRS